MTKEEIFDYNKRCAEFLNFEISENEKCFKLPNKNGWVTLSIFHSDWNWIMEVYMKINECRITLPMFGIEDSITPLLIKRRPLKDAILDGNKEQLAKAINQFLIWYNEQKK